MFTKFRNHNAVSKLSAGRTIVLFKLHKAALNAARRRYYQLSVELESIPGLPKSKQEAAYEDLLKKLRVFNLAETALDLDDRYTSYHSYTKGKSQARVRKFKTQLDTADDLFVDIGNLEIKALDRLTKTSNEG